MTEQHEDNYLDIIDRVLEQFERRVASLEQGGTAAREISDHQQERIDYLEVDRQEPITADSTIGQMLARLETIENAAIVGNVANRIRGLQNQIDALAKIVERVEEREQAADIRIGGLEVDRSELANDLAHLQKWGRTVDRRLDEIGENLRHFQGEWGKQVDGRLDLLDIGVGKISGIDRRIDIAVGQISGLLDKMDAAELGINGAYEMIGTIAHSDGEPIETIAQQLDRIDKTIYPLADMLTRLTMVEGQVKNVYEPIGATEAGRAFLIYPEYIQRLIHLENWRRTAAAQLEILAAGATGAPAPAPGDLTDMIGEVEHRAAGSAVDLDQRLDEHGLQLERLGTLAGQILERLDRVEGSADNVRTWVTAVDKTIEQYAQELHGAQDGINDLEQLIGDKIESESDWRDRINAAITLVSMTSSNFGSLDERVINIVDDLKTRDEIIDDLAERVNGIIEDLDKLETWLIEGGRIASEPPRETRDVTEPIIVKSGKVTLQAGPGISLYNTDDEKNETGTEAETPSTPTADQDDAKKK